MSERCIVSSTSSISCSLFLVLLVFYAWLADWLALIGRWSWNGSICPVRWRSYRKLLHWWYEGLCPGIGGLLWCRYHRYRLPVLHRFWYWRSLLLVLVVWYLLSFVPRWLWCLELMVPLKRVVFHFLVSVAHAFFNRMGTVFLLTCLVVGRLGIGVREVSVCSRLPVSLCRADGWAAYNCSQFTHFRVRFLLSLHWFDACLPAQYLHVLAWCPNVWQLNHCSGSHHKGPHSETPVPSGKSVGVLFHTSTTVTMFVGSNFCFSVFHLVILKDSSTPFSCCSSSRVTQDGIPFMIYTFHLRAEAP